MTGGYIELKMSFATKDKCLCVLCISCRFYLQYHVSKLAIKQYSSGYPWNHGNSWHRRLPRCCPEDRGLRQRSRLH